MPSQTFTVIQNPTESCDGLGLVALNSAGDLVTIWSGEPPAIPPGIHPRIAQALEQGGGDIGPCWIEERSGQQVLADLPLPIPLSGAISLCIQLADALAALHARGLAHGWAGLDSVVISKSGTPMWIGTGRQKGSSDEDIAALQAMSLALNPAMPDLAHVSTAASLAAQWRESQQPTQEFRPWLANHPPSSAETHTPVTLDLIPLGTLDEVQPDLGEDTQGRGILDRWRTGEDEGDLTDDPTVSVDAGAIHAQTRQHILNSLFQALDAAVDAQPATTSTVSFQVDFSEESLDPTPTLNGLDHGLIHNPGGQRERTADVPHPEITHPTADRMDDTTGLTGAIPIQQSVMTGLLMAAVLGMLGAAVMLTLVWLIIGDVF